MKTFEIMYRNNINTLLKAFIEAETEQAAVKQLRKEVKATGNKLNIFMVIER